LGSTGIARRNTLVSVTLPSASHVKHGLDKAYYDFIIIGWPIAFHSSEPLIQLADHFGSLEEIGPFLSWMNERRSYDIGPAPYMVIYADAKVPMGMIKAVKRELQLNGHYRVWYAVTPVHWRCWPGPKYLPE